MRLPLFISAVLLLLLTSCYGAQQTINLGTTPSDGTGDSLRNAFTKVNANFTELYSLSSAINASNITTGTLPIARLADGSVTNAKLASSSITINGSAVSLGGSVTINGATWGSITGTLSDQTDLQTALNGKLNNAAAAAFQPVDTDLNAIAALTTTTFGRSLLTQADAAATRSTLGISSAGGVLSGSYPSPGFAVDMAEQSELNSALTTLNASNLTTGTLPIARLADGGVTLAKLGSLPLQDETLAYYKAVLAAGGSISAEVLMALDEVICDGKQNMWWDNIIEAYTNATDGFSGVFVKLKAASGAPASLVNNNFVAADYTRGGGFGVDSGNSTKWLQTGFIPSSLGYDRTNIGVIMSICSETVTAGGGSGRTLGDMITGNAGECGVFATHSSTNIVVGNGTYQGFQSLNPTARVISFQSSGPLHHTCADGVQYTSWTQTTTGTLTGEITMFRVTRFSAARYDNGRIGFTAITSYMTPTEAKAATAAIAKFERRIRTIYGREAPGILLWGDSIMATQGGTSTNDGFSQIVARRLGLRPVNHGNPAAWLTTTSGPMGAVNQLTDILAQPERTILMMFGSNDVQYSVTDSTYNTHLTTICNAAIASGARRRLVICTPSYTANAGHQTTLRGYAVRCAAIAVTTGLPFADTNIAGADNPQQTDTVHPNTTGHLQMADVITASLRGVQLRKPTIDLGSLAAGASTSGTLTMLTARAGQPVSITPPATWDTGMLISGYVSTNDTVTYTVTNTTGGSVDEESGIYTFTVTTGQ